MDRLELELGGEILFDMNLFDYETGLNHKIKVRLILKLNQKMLN